MKIIVLHGDDTLKSYERLTKFIDEAKRRNWEILYDSISETDSLFGKERLTILRDYKLFTSKKINGTSVIYHEGSLPQTFLKTLPKETKVEEFKLPVLLWKFLDKINISGFHKVIEREPPEFVFTLICNLFRDLYWVKTDPTSLGYPSWRISKLETQAAKYSTSQVAEIINKLAKIDVDVKTGQAELVSSLDLFFIKYLQ